MGQSDQQRLLAVMFTERREVVRLISARRATRRNGETMKKAKRSERAVPQIDPDEILPEYDFSRARPNKYAPRYQKGALVVTLDPEVAQVFQSAEDVNQTLRLLARIIRAGRDRRSKKTPGA